MRCEGSLEGTGADSSSIACWRSTSGAAHSIWTSGSSATTCACSFALTRGGIGGGYSLVICDETSYGRVTCAFGLGCAAGAV